MKKVYISILTLCMVLSLITGCIGNDNPVEASAESSVSAGSESSESESSEPETKSDEEMVPQTSPQGIGLTGVANARELGGYSTQNGKVIKSGLLIRCGKLMDTTDEDISVLVENFNLGYIVDFRGPIDRRDAPDPEFPGVASYGFDLMGTQTEKLKAEEAAAESGNGNETEESSAKESTEETETPEYEFSWLNLIVQWRDEGINATEAFGGKLYTDLVSSEYAVDGIKGAFNVLLEADDDKAILFHCNAGKDRTGIFCALLLHVLGADTETIYDDFMITNDFTVEEVQKYVDRAALETDDEYLLSEVRVMAEVNSAFLDASFAKIAADYGSVDAFLSDTIGLSADDVAVLQAKYTE